MTYFEAAENIAKILHGTCSATIREAVDSAVTLVMKTDSDAEFTFGELDNLERNVTKGFQEGE